MSRSNPHDNDGANPATRWHEWQGEQGVVQYYDKEKKEQVVVAQPFTFMLLDQLGSVRGWHELSKSGIYSNEVRDTRHVLIVKAFKGGTLAEGIYKDIKERINAQGGSFAANLYVAYKLGGELAIGSFRLKGAALGAWMDFSKANRADLYKKAIKVTGFTEGKKGRVTFRVPTFALADVNEQTNEQAVVLDKKLQAFLTAYLGRTKREQVETAPHHAAPVDHEPDNAFPSDGDEGAPADITSDDIPFSWLLPLVGSLTAFGSFVA